VQDAADIARRPVLEARGLSKTFTAAGRSVVALAEVTMEVEAGAFATVVGPSGCGKTTLLRCLAGLLSPSAGEVRLEGEVVTAPPKQVAVVFQDYSRSLFPWLSARDNVMLPLRQSDLDSAARRSRVKEALAEVSLAEYADYYPRQMSGGMQQRVAIARAIAYRPRVLLMDEPFASVDAQTRSGLQDMILRLHELHEMTTVFVTHDIDEAIYLSDRLHVLGPAPTRVLNVVDVDLPAERDQIKTKADPRFQSLRGELWRQLGGPALATRAGDAPPAQSQG
jgi:NitT/TauT family transport system ATP-binding protein